MGGYCTGGEHYEAWQLQRVKPSMDGDITQQYC